MMTLIEHVWKQYCWPRFAPQAERDAEVNHERGVLWMEWPEQSKVASYFIRLLLEYRHPMLEQEICGVHFPLPLILAPGGNKYGRLWNGLADYGWGGQVLGGITWDVQDGNPDRPRWRYSDACRAGWNQMGFNNPGAVNTARILSQKPRSRIPVILNVSKSARTLLEEAPEEFRRVIEAVGPYCDMAELGISSPNTARTRELQRPGNLREVIRAAKAGQKMVLRSRASFPIGAKFAPDLSEEELQDGVDVCVEEGVDFITIVNTTTSRKGVECWDIPQDRGGVSGKPLRTRRLECLSMVHRELMRKGARRRVALFAVGGIGSPEDLFLSILNGADACQALTLWPPEGPDFPKRCCKGLVRMLRQNGFTHIQYAVGKGL